MRPRGGEAGPEGTPERGAPWDTFVRPQVFAQHSGGGGVTL